ncbi:helix-hairpin-helix domain-containing protein [Streptomyces sp. SCSIO 30461]|uniref:helix-hairpin-helix domain-containing protein n=1 Tax=Streptomyces sp. SCSIO 30461 TaxID=3118085 RepID=UPI0030CCD4F5
MTAQPGAIPGPPEDEHQDAAASDVPGAAEADAEAADPDVPGAAEADAEAADPDVPGAAEADAEAADPDVPGAAEADAEAADPDVPGAAEADAEAADPDGKRTDAGELSDAEVELAAHRELRARIEQRKAGKPGPIEAGAKLSGTAADLLAAVRAVESGQKVSGPLFERPTSPRSPAASSVPPPVRPRTPEPEQGPRGPGAAAVAAVLEVLVSGGAPEGLAERVAGVLGEQAAQLLRDDPWRLLAVPGVRPEQADGFARALLGAECGPGDGRRAVGLVSWLLEQAARQGHTALEAAAVREALGARSVPDPDEALKQVITEGAVLVFQDGLDYGAEDEGEGEGAGGEEGAGAAGHGGAAIGPERPSVPVLVGLDRYALAEESLADGLARLVRTGLGDADWEGPDLVRAVGGHGLVVHTGGEAARAEVLALVEAARAHGLRAMVTTHSENGRRRSGDADAVTLRGLLSGVEGPGRDADGGLAVDVLAVLDASQLDVESAAMLVESLPDGSRLVLSGDPGVLGPAGAGQVFADVLAARVCPQIASRVPDPGPIGELVSGIGIGELNQVAAPGKEVVIVPVRDASEAVHRTVQLVADSVPRAIGVPPERTQVITVGHGGSAGTRALNAALKERLNPGPGRFGGFDPGDRVAYAPSPGRVLCGTVLSADAEGLRVEGEGAAIAVPREQVGSALRHGWALTAHQAAGSRWPAAVVVLPGDAAQGLSRPWVYTAFSRGERHLSVVHGVEQALVHAVAHVPAQARTTRLRTLLEGLLAAPDE